MRRSITAAAISLIVVGSVAAVLAQDLSAPDREKIVAATEHVLRTTNVPSASVGITRGGKVIYAEAFGAARLPQNVGVASSAGGKLAISAETTKPLPANAGMAYPVGSISKQFTSICILLLQERGKLKLDDPVSKWFPTFTRANEVTIRNLLTHTSGYSDYAPQDYTIPAWTRTIEPLDLVTEWATKPLDFTPGTQWQYSNTNFQLAALIVQKASGMRFHDFLWQNVITPLKLQGVLDLDVDRDKLQVRGYEQHALGPLRPAILEAPGWYFGDGELAMPVSTLLAWDESIVHRSLLKPESYDAFETEFVLKSGKGSHYGLGTAVNTLPDGRKILSHSGEVGGFVANNVISLSDDVAYAALTNQEASPAASAITKAIRPILLPDMHTPKAPKPAAMPAPAVQTTPAKASAPSAETGGDHSPDPTESNMATLLTSLQEEDIDRTLFTSDANFYFSDETIHDFAESLAPLGAVERVKKTSESLRGGMTFRSFDVIFAKGKASLTTYTVNGGRIEQFLVGPAE